MHTSFDRLWTLSAPFSQSTLPLINGLGRRAMLQHGASQREAHLHGAWINFYQQAPEAPQGPPLLLLHGLADNALTWSLVFNRLGRTRRVFALDLPGYGISTLPPGQRYASLELLDDVVEAFVREVVGEPALLVGNSMGGWLSVRVANKAPELVRGMVLIDAGGAPLQGHSSWDPFAKSLEVSDLRATRQLLRLMFGVVPPTFDYMIQHGFQAMLQRQVVHEFVAAVQENDFLSAADVRALPVPAGLIWGLADRFLPSGSLEFFRDNLPDPNVLLLPHCGHVPQRERPRAVTTFVEQFAQALADAEHAL